MLAGYAYGTSGTSYTYGGFRWELPLSERFSLAPGFAAGLYDSGSVFDLGGTLEFRSSVELTYSPATGGRFGIGIHHLSNGGIYGQNPGTEAVWVSYSIGL
jgi:hypothetical protein